MTRLDALYILARAHIDRMIERRMRLAELERIAMWHGRPYARRTAPRRTTTT